MKKFRRIVSLFIIMAMATVLAAVLLGCAFAADNSGGGDEEHEHTFETEWTTTFEAHYHKAKCEHDVTADYGEHELDTEIVKTDKYGEYYACKVCGYLKQVSHDYGEPQLLREAELCTENSYYLKTCKKCEFELEYSQKYDYHDYSDWKIVSDEAHERSCKRCNFKQSHEPKSMGGEVLQAADCTHPGVKKTSCRVCLLDMEEALSPLGHAWQSKSVDDTYHSCLCTRCGERAVFEHTVIYATEIDGVFHNAHCEDCNVNKITAHDFSDGECICGLTYAESDGLVYAQAEGGLNVVGIGAFSGKYLNIPAEHNGETVVGIAEDAFKRATALWSVYVSDSVTYIGAGAFSGCNSIGSMRLPFIGEQKREATDLHQYPIGYIFGENDDGIAQKFYDDSLDQTTQKRYSIPSSLKYLSVGGGVLLSGALRNTDFTNIILESGVTAIEQDALPGSREIRLTVSETVTSIADGVLADLNFNSLHVDPKNTRYKFANNCFIDTEEKAVLAALPDCVIPDDGTVTTLCDGAFSNRAFQALPRGSSIVIPSAITHIGDSCFYNANLTVTIESKKLTYIGDSAFKDCYRVSGFTLNCDDDVYIGDMALGCIAGTVEINCVSLDMGVNAFASSAIGYFTLKSESATFGNGAFRDCRSITSISIECDSVEIGDDFAYESFNLLSVDIAGLTDLGVFAFKGCSKLYQASLSGEIEKITQRTFSDCAALTKLTLPEKINKIESLAFSGCTSLKKVEISDQVTEIENFILDKCDSITELKIPFLPGGNLGNLFSKTNYSNAYYAAVQGNSAAYTYYIPKSLKKVSVSGGDLYYAFTACTSLTELNLGINGEYSGSVTSGSFVGVGIKHLDVPNGLGFSTAEVFTGMSALKTVVWRLNTDVAGPYFKGCSAVESLTITSGVTSIMPNAFYGLKSLREVDIPDTVTEIGQYAFGGSALTSLHIPFLDGTLGSLFSAVAVSGSTAVTQSTANEQEVYYIPDTLADVTVSGNIQSGAFMNCKFIKSVTCLGEDIELGDNAFKNCTGITSFISPNVTKIGTSAFENCKQIAEIELGDLTEINSCAFKGCTKLATLVMGLPADLTTIPDGLFDGCAALTAFDIPGTVDTIGERAFAGMAISAVVLPQQITQISDGLFDGCAKLAEITIPANVASVGNNAFRGCAALATAVAQGSLESIGVNAFSGCSSLVDATLPGTYTALSSGLFDGCAVLDDPTLAPNITVVENRAFAMCGALGTFDFSELTEIGDEAFMGCSSLSTVTIPATLITIGKGAFSGCTGVTTVRLYAPSAISAATQAEPIFSGCTALSAVEIGGAVNTIPAYMFTGCKGLTSLTLDSQAITQISEGAFMNTGLTSLALDELADGIVIGRRAFYGCDDITDFSMKSGQFTVGEEAFFGMNKQTALVLELGQNATIGKGAFGGWSALAEITTNDVKGGVKSEYYFGRIFGSVDYEGAIAQAQHGNLGDQTSVYYLPVALKKVTVTGGEISRGAFSGLSEITEVVICDPVINLFSAYVFSGCTSLTTLTIPESYDPTAIPEHMFAGCALTSFDLLERVRIVNAGAFAGSKLTSAVIGNGKAGGSITIYKGAFENCTELTAVAARCTSELNVYESAFGGCSALGTFTSDNRVKATIGKSAFDGCVSLSSLDLSKSAVVELSEYAFKDCGSLTEIYLDNVTEIGKGALSGCVGIEELRLKFVGKNASTDEVDERTIGYIYGDLPFYGGIQTSLLNGTYYIPTSLKKITLTEGTIHSYAFKGCVGATEINIPDQNIPGYAFVDCVSITSFDFNSNSIGNGAFTNCTSLSTVSLGSNITSIGEEAFSGCVALESITIPASVMRIEKAAFRGCTSLSSATFEVTTNWMYFEATPLSSELFATTDSAAYVLTVYLSFPLRRLF